MVTQRIRNHAAVEGSLTDVYVYLSPNEELPTDETLTAATGGAAKGATSITLTSGLLNKLYAGQSLTFYNTTTGEETLATLTADAAVGATVLTNAALAKAIAAGATAEVPAYVWDRTAADLDRQANFSATSGYNDSRTSQNGVITGGSGSFSLPGRYHEENAGARTLVYAGANGLKVFVKRILKASNSSVYSEGRSHSFFAFVNSYPSASPNEGNVSEDFTFTIVGEIIETAPTPV